MVDELIIPGERYERDPFHLDECEMIRMHVQWRRDLEQLKSQIEAQTEKPRLLWIACAGIEEGKTEHFKQSYLTTVLSPVFHIPQMDLPLRNTKQTLVMAGLEGNTDVKGLNTSSTKSKAKSNPVYKIPDLLMAGVQGKEFLFNNRDDADELATVVETACKEILRRTGGAGFPILCDSWNDSKISIVKRGVERAGGTALIFNRYPKESCSEVEVEEWLRRRRSGEEKRCLILDWEVSRGWEASHVLVVAFNGDGLENLVMRTVGYCALVKPADNSGGI